MDNLIDLKKIWHSAGTDDLPSPEEVMQAAKKFRNQKLRKKAALILAAFLLVCVELWVVFVYKSTMLTTRIGEAFIVIAGTILLLTNANSIGRFYRFNDFSNKEFLAFLEQTRLNQIYYYKKTQVTAFVFCSIGLLLYPFEMLYTSPVLFFAVYAFIILYLCVLGFIVRPRVFRKQAAKLNDTIKKLEIVSKQLN
ncbi:MAG: hypothetical protein JWP94_2483 [Mucilaginibacter sp.]|jgi:hypothetical protein|nr:hypothetical protein [Mucilaginibacter sp.]